MLLSWAGAGARAAVFALCALVALPAAADEVGAIATPGQGELTMCPYSGCNLYHHIVLPPHIAVGDKVPVHFGSNPKSYRFPVARIVRDGDSCALFSQTAETTDVEKIEVASCRVTAQAQ